MFSEGVAVLKPLLFVRNVKMCMIVSSCLISFVSKQLFAFADGWGSVTFIALFQNRLDHSPNHTASELFQLLTRHIVEMGLCRILLEICCFCVVEITIGPPHCNSKLGELS